jgi:S-DNA-T family DNA segregation ATPase FtsK/SpoIIIE
MPKKKAVKTTTSPLAKKWTEGIKNLIQSPVNHAVIGLFLVFCGVFLLGSLIGYLLVWQEDMSAINKGFWALLGDKDFKVNNVLGKIGAGLGHTLMYRAYGVAAFAWVYLILNIGLRITFNISFKNFYKTLINTLFVLIWLPSLFGMLFPESLDLFKGAHGHFGALWLKGVFGSVGAFLVLFFALLVFLSARMRWTPEIFAQWLKKKPKKDALPWESETSIGMESISYEEEAAKVREELALKKKQEEEAEEEGAFTFEVRNEESDENPSHSASSLEIDPSVKKTTQPEKEPEEAEFEINTTKEKVLDESEAERKLREFGAYDPTLDLSQFQMPGIDLLNDYGSGQITVNQAELEQNKDKIVETLKHYGIEISKIKATIGPTVTLYEIVPAAGVRISKIKNLEDDIALNLAALGIRIIAPIPGKGTIGIEVPNANPQMVPMRNLLSSEKFIHSQMELPIVLGKTISNETFVTDLTKMPHLLMAGATGQGKSVGINVILTSILYKKHPSQVKLILVDPKKVELNLYNKIERHYLAKLPNAEEAIITDVKKVIYTLNSLCIEMDNRYELLKNAMVRNLKEYNEKFVNRRLNPEEGHRYLPYIVLVIDEFADLIMTAGKEIETPIARLAQLARAIGIHLIVATQRPSVNVITGIIKANFPARIAFRVSSKIDSRTILDAGGADQLIGRGDMLLSTGNDLTRLQCAFIDTPEAERLVDFIGNQRGYPEAYQLPEYEGEESDSGIPDIDLSKRDSKFDEAARLIVATQQGSASLVQRKLGLGYNRAGRIIDQLEAAGIIGPFEGSKARQVLVLDDQELEQVLNNIKQKNS